MTTDLFIKCFCMFFIEVYLPYTRHNHYLSSTTYVSPYNFRLVHALHNMALVSLPHACNLKCNISNQTTNSNCLFSAFFKSNFQAVRSTLKLEVPIAKSGKLLVSEEVCPYPSTHPHTHPHPPTPTLIQTYAPFFT